MYKSSKTETVVPKKEHQPLPPPTGAYYRATKPIDKLRAGDLILLWTEEGQIHGQFGDEGFYYDEEEFAGHFIPAPEGRSERLKQIETILTEANAEKNITPDVLQLPLSVEEGTNPEAALVTTKHRSSIIEAKKAALLAKKRVEVIKTELHGLLMEQQTAPGRFPVLKYQSSPGSPVALVARTRRFRPLTGVPNNRGVPTT